MSDLFAWKQKVNKGYTQRQLSEDTQIGLGLFTKILRSQRDLSARVMLKLADFFELDDDQSHDLELLVLYNQSKTHQEKLERLKDLMASRSNQVQSETLDKKYYEFYTQWYHSAIREVISSGAFCGSYKELSQILVPAIGVRQVKSSIALLIDLGLIEEISSTKGQLVWKVKSALISSNQELAKTSVRKFNQDMMDKAKKALDLFGPDERNMSTVTLSIDEAKYPLLEEKVRQFRQEIMDIAASDQDSNKVLQLNLQLFPLSHKIDSRSKG